MTYYILLSRSERWTIGKEGIGALFSKATLWNPSSGSGFLRRYPPVIRFLSVLIYNTSPATITNQWNVSLVEVHTNGRNHASLKYWEDERREREREREKSVICVESLGGSTDNWPNSANTCLLSSALGTTNFSHSPLALSALRKCILHRLLTYTT